MKIAIVGAQSTGKSTLIEAIKLILPDFSYHTNTTRHLKSIGYKINELGDDETQLVISEIHSEVSKKKGNIIIDRSVLDTHVYTHYLYDKDSVSYETLCVTKKRLLNNINNYDFIFYLKPEFDLVDDGHRSNDLEFRDSIVKLFDYYIDRYDIPVFNLTGSVDDRVGQFKSITQLPIK